jgi:hypothetical protein
MFEIKELEDASGVDLNVKKVPKFAVAEGY